MLPGEVFDVDRIITASPVIVMWGEPLASRPVDFVTTNISRLDYSVPDLVMERVPFESILFPDDRDRVASSFATALADGRDSLTMDYRIVTGSGEVRWVEDQVSFHRDPEGKPLLYQSCIMDITDRKMMELRFRYSEERLERVLALARIGVWEYSPETDEITGGGRASLFGMKEGEMPVSREELWDRIIRPEDRDRHERLWNDAVGGRAAVFQNELRAARADGSEMWIFTKGFPVRDADGRLLRLQGVTVDITDLKQAEEKLVRQSQRLSLLHGISLAFMEELDTRILVRRVLEMAVEFAGASDGIIGVIEDENFIRNVSTAGSCSGLEGRRIPVSAGIFGEVLRQGRRVVIEDYRVYPDRIEAEELKDVRTVVGIPLQRGGYRIGAIAVMSVGEPMRLEESTLAMLDQFAAAASIALENARLYEEARREVEERERAEMRLRSHQVLAEAAARGANFLLSGESGQGALSLALQSVGRAAGADKAALYRNMLDSDGAPYAGLLALSVVQEGSSDLFPVLEHVPMSGGLSPIYESLSAGMPFHGVVVPTAEFNIPDAREFPVTMSVIPVFIRSEFWGVMTLFYVDERPPFEPDEIDVLRTAAYNMAASVIRWDTEREVGRGYEKLRQTFVDVIRTMGQIVGKKDPYTIEHQERVAALACELGGRLGMPEERREGLRIAGLVHDIGKIEIPGEILSKPGRLSRLEFELIKTHALSGYDILSEVDFPWPVAEIALQHHERMDGSGYPNGLKGDSILEEARIVAVADVVESMMSHRPYRPSLGLDAALDEIREKRGTLYDPAVVDACLALFTERPGFIAEH